MTRKICLCKCTATVKLYLGGNGHPDATVIVANNGDDPLNGGSPAIVLNKMVPAL